MTLYKEPRGYKGRINDYFDFNPRSKESESTTCKIHDWIKYDREPGNTPIDICRNCDTTKIDGKTYSCNLCEYLGREHSEESKRIAELNQTHTCGKLNPSKSTGLEEERKMCCKMQNSLGLVCVKCLDSKEEPKSTLRETQPPLIDLIEDIIIQDELLRGEKADKIISLFKDTLLKQIEKTEMPGYQDEGAEHAHAGYVRALEDIINKIKNL